VIHLLDRITGFVTHGMFLIESLSFLVDYLCGIRALSRIGILSSLMEWADELLSSIRGSHRIKVRLVVFRLTLQVV